MSIISRFSCGAAPGFGWLDAPQPRQVGELSAVAWRQGKLGYVLLGKAPAQSLTDLARRIADGQTGRLYGRIGNRTAHDAA